MRQLLLATVVLLACRSTLACDDGFIHDAQQQMDAAHVVFAGQAESVELFPPSQAGLFGSGRLPWNLPWPPHKGYQVVFRVSTSLKGQADKRMTVWTGTGNGDCGFSFMTGRTYVVYARHDASGQLATDIYSGTRLQ